MRTKEINLSLIMALTHEKKWDYILSLNQMKFWLVINCQKIKKIECFFNNFKDKTKRLYIDICSIDYSFHFTIHIITIDWAYSYICMCSYSSVPIRICRLSIDIYLKCNSSTKANCAYDFSTYLKKKERR